MSETWAYELHTLTIRQSDGRRVGDIYWTAKTQDAVHARGFLMAAAPELLEACEDLIHSLCDAEGRLVEAECDEGLYMLSIAAAQAAIAKAKGEAS